MPLRWHGFCTLPVALRQLHVGRRGCCPQYQTRCIAKLCRCQRRLITRKPPTNNLDARSSPVLAVKSQDQKCATSTFAAQQKIILKHLQSALPTRHHFSTCTSSLQLGDGLIDRDGAASFPLDLPSQLTRKKAKIGVQEKSKENRLLVNQLLKDKGRLSYDWRVPVELLEQHHESRNAQRTNTDLSLFRKVVAISNTASEHQGSVLLRKMNYRTERMAKPVCEITKPSVWSKMTLADHVENLVEYEYYKDMIPQTSQLREKAFSNVADIVAAFSEIFYSPTTMRFLSIRAYRTALRFYYEKRLFSEARALFIQLEDSQMEIPTEVFNLVLRGSASARDLHNFTFILQKCIQRGFKPDMETWNALLTTINSSEVRAVIIQRMWERGILGMLPRKGNELRLIVQQEVGSHIDKRGDRGAFLDHMDDRYGKTWLTTSTGNKLLHEFGKRRPIPEALSLLPGMKLRGWRPDEISLNTLLRQSLLLKQTRYAVDILQNFQRYWGLRPGKQAYETLFLLALRRRLLNFARVIWASACIYGHVTMRMRSYVSQSLRSSTAVNPADGSWARFRKVVGQFIVGIDPPQEVPLSGMDVVYEERKIVIRPPTLESAQILQQRDLLAAGGPRIQEDLGKLLLRALQLDMEWQASKLLTRADLQQISQSGVRIPRTVTYRQLRRFRISRCVQRETQGPRLIQKVSTARLSIRSHYAHAFRKLKAVRSQTAGTLRSGKRAMTPKAKAQPAGTRTISKRPRASPLRRSVTPDPARAGTKPAPVAIQNGLVKHALHESTTDPMQRETSVQLNVSKRSTPSVNRRLDQENPAESSQSPVPQDSPIRSLSVIQPTNPEFLAGPTAGKSPSRRFQRKPSSDPVIRTSQRKVMTLPNSPVHSPDQGVKSRSVLTPERSSEPVVISRAESRKRFKPVSNAATRNLQVRDTPRMPKPDSSQERFPVLPEIRTLPLGISCPEASASATGERLPVSPKTHKQSSSIVKQDNNPLIRKHIAEKDLISPTTPKPSTFTLRKELKDRNFFRKHQAVVYTKHSAAQHSHEAPVDPDDKPVAESLETARIHSSLDDVLDLNEALGRGEMAGDAQIKTGSCGSSSFSGQSSARSTIQSTRRLPTRRRS